ncbi:MAG: substrate-binding domain-containing protein [Propionibacteriaceae bacterium]|jgi:ABC-type sugar transport system substrate-binding protein|nr:substrate-binding domain-containing protein [Propionibacteriaceae bacterium]
MKKLAVAFLGAAVAISLAACSVETGQSTPATDSSTSAEGGKVIYVLGPTPDHGWTAQAGTFASKRVDEINAEGRYKAEYKASSSGDEENDIVTQIIANNDAAGVVFFALDDSAKSGAEALIEAGIPFMFFDRIIEGPDASAVLNYSGDNWAVGAGIAYWLQKNGMKPGDTLVEFIGDNGTVSGRRDEGFKNFLTGGDASKGGEYSDKLTGETYKTSEAWTSDQVDKLMGQYKVVCDWSADKAQDYLDQQLADIIKDAKGNGGNLYVYSMDDEMTFGFLNLIESNSIDDSAKADLEKLNVYVSAIGGMQELYDVMLGSSKQSPTAEKYFDGLMSVYFNPAMMTSAIDYMVQYLDGSGWTYETGAGEYEPVFIVDKSNAADVEGFTGH